MAESYEDRQESTVTDFEKELKDIQDRGLSAREEAGPDKGESEEEYYERIRNVPGIFGDTDTTAGSSGTATDVPSANNEEATVAAAEVQAESEDELNPDENAAARRQVDVAKGTTVGVSKEEGSSETEEIKSEATAGDDDVKKGAKDTKSKK